MEPLQFGNYTLLERISHGGMAEVFRAKSFGEAGFEREVALKLLLPSMASDEEFVNMLIDEAKIAGQLNHANIAQIFDLGVADARYYIVQEYVRGQDLRSILRHKAETGTRFEIATACHIALKICEGLHYAHNKRDPRGQPLNLVHRDISPHNILISTEGEVKIIDFGIAKAEGRSTQTMSGLVKGKFAYMSPEQIRGLPVDHRSDVFATGILLHEMLTNRPLFRRSSEFETLKRAREASAEPPSQLNPEVPEALDRIVLKALARHVDDRYQTALDLRDELWAFAREYNAFTGDAELKATAEGSEDGSSFEIDLASEVHYITERSRSEGESRAEADPLESSSVFVDQQDPTILGDDYGDAEADEDDADDVEDGNEGNSTVVDPKLPFGMYSSQPEEGEEATDEAGRTPTDHDAQWAADLAGPLASAFTLPTRSPGRALQQRHGDEEEETTSDHGRQNDVSTARYGQSAPQDIEESTEVRPHHPGSGDAGESFAPPPQPPNFPEEEATTKERRLKLQLAPTQPSRLEDIVKRPPTKPSSTSRNAGTDDAALARTQRVSGSLAAGRRDQTSVARARSRHLAYRDTDSPDVVSQPPPLGERAPSPDERAPSSPGMPSPPPVDRSSISPIDLSPVASEPSPALGLAHAPTAQAPAMPALPPLPVAQPAWSSSSQAPFPLPPQASVTQHVHPMPQLPGPGALSRARVYWLMAAVFLLLLAAGTTITLLIAA